MDKEKENQTKTEPEQPVKKKKGERERLCEELDALKAELASSKELLLRTAAEYDNYRKRTEKEKQSSADYGLANAVSAMLPALDNLERAAAAESADAEYKKGVEMTLRQFHEALCGLGVAEIEALGKPFDPDYHAAAAQLAAEGAESGTVTAVMQKGYKKDARVIRHAMVAVAP